MSPQNVPIAKYTWRVINIYRAINENRIDPRLERLSREFHIFCPFTSARQCATTGAERPTFH